MPKEAAAKRVDCGFDAVAQVFKHARAAFLRELRPFFQPAKFSPFVFDPGLVTEQPEHDEVGVHFPIEHRRQIKFHERLTRKRDVIAQDPETIAIRDKTPKVHLGPIQHLLH